MTCLRPIILRALVLFGISCSSLALGPNDDASCCLYPDPHASSFHGVVYDYQKGCDNILVENTNIKIHARFVKYQQTANTGFSYIEGIGIEFASNGDTIEIRPNNYYINDQALANPFNPNAGPSQPTIGGLSFNINILTNYGTTGYEYEIQFPPVVGLPTHNIVIEDWTAGLGAGSGNDRGYGVSMCINAHGSYFQGSVGMCGEWDAPFGLSDRNGNDMIPNLGPGPVYNAAAFGDEWQVVDPTDDPFMSLFQTFPPSGHNYHPNQCQARRRLNAEDTTEVEVAEDQQRKLNYDNDCGYCNSLDHEIKRINCHFDASVLGCDFAKNLGQVYYGEKSQYFNNIPDPYMLIVKPEQCKKYYPSKWKRTKCQKKGGECVRYCDTKDEKIQCILGWCNQKKPYKFPKGKEILLYGQYYNGCACMLKKKQSDVIDEDINDGPNEGPE